MHSLDMIDSRPLQRQLLLPHASMRRLIALYCWLGFFDCLPLAVLLPALLGISLVATLVESLPINQVGGSWRPLHGLLICLGLSACLRGWYQQYNKTVGAGPTQGAFRSLHSQSPTDHLLACACPAGNPECLTEPASMLHGPCRCLTTTCQCLWWQLSWP